ncbi:MAG: O-antigen ligase family protein [Candidatus Magasanikbacteria bacterium]|nr:O-antigen ligase family protein [Candidatus Magasanikbacteria bacterium]
MSDFLLNSPIDLWGLFLLILVFVFSFLLLFAMKKPYWLIYFLLVWLPLENLILRYAPIWAYGYIKYLPEVLIYSFFFFTWYFYAKNTKQLWPRLAINKWLLAFVGIGAISLLFNWYSPMIWFLGMRQLLRFVLLIFIIIFLRCEESVIKKIVNVGAIVLGLEVLIGLAQYFSNGALDRYLFFSPAVTIGGLAAVGGLEQSWAPGSRVFSTLGRYDQLGSWLAVGLLLAFPFVYHLKNTKYKSYLWCGFFVGVLVLGLTMSRASWLAFVFGIVAIGWFLYKDKKVLYVFGFLTVLLAGYLIGFAWARDNVSQITEKSRQTLAERMFEAVSLRAWQNSYDGYGRIFFIINTPRMVVPASPLWGVGPGNYGGGAAAALLNTEVYNRLRLPFGIQDIYGQIDNSWFSIWGEFGTVGLIFWAGMFIVIIKTAKNIYKNSSDGFARLWSAGMVGATVGVVVVGFFGPYFEFRSLMAYYWVGAGLLLMENVKIKMENS